MSVPLKIVASRAQDLYLRDFWVQTDFFTKNDFEFHTYATATSLYRDEFAKGYAQLRADNIDEVISFDDGYLSEQILKVKRVNNDPISMWEAELLFNAMSFPYDNNDCGFQSVFIIDPNSETELERSNVDTTWNYKYLPTNNRIFWRVDKNKLKFFTKGKCNVNAVRILYIPALDLENPDIEVPEGIVELVIAKTVATIKGLSDDRVIKSTTDLNSNKVMQSELNTESLKR